MGFLIVLTVGERHNCTFVTIVGVNAGDGLLRVALRLPGWYYESWQAVLGRNFCRVGVVKTQNYQSGAVLRTTYVGLALIDCVSRGHEGEAVVFIFF